MADSKQREAALAKAEEILGFSRDMLHGENRKVFLRIADAFQRERNEALGAAIDLAESMIVGQPKPYSWAKQNYNAGHDQALHALVKELRRRGEEG